MTPNSAYRNEILLEAGFPSWVVMGDYDHLFLDRLYGLATNMTLEQMSARFPDFNPEWLEQLIRLRNLPNCPSTDGE
jgi:hypothetical protein